MLLLSSAMELNIRVHERLAMFLDDAVMWRISDVGTRYLRPSRRSQPEFGLVLTVRNMDVRRFVAFAAEK